MQEPLTRPAVAALLERLVGSLQQKAPRSFKCVFLNCELHQTDGGATVSADLFSVTKRPFGTPKRDQRTLVLEEVRLLDTLTPLLIEGTDLRHATLDVIVRSDKTFSAFVTFGPLHRIGGNDDFFKSKHLEYVHLEPWLSRLT